MSVVHAWVGATTPSSATVVTKVTGSSVRLAVSESAGLTSPVYFGPVSPNAQGIARVTATGLAHSGRYHFAVEDSGVLDSAFRGQFRTHPPAGQPASFTIGLASCAGGTPDFPGVGSVLAPGRLSNSTVFDTIRAKAVAENWLLFIHAGDRHYYDIGSEVHVPGFSLTTYRRAYDDVMAQPRQHALYRNVATAYMYDDHDFGPNNSDRTAPGRANSIQAYRERVPHYPLGATGTASPNYQSFQIGRVLFVLWDCRADRDPAGEPAGTGKTMLGAGQRAWFENLLATSGAAALVVVNTSQWDTNHPDTWGGYTHERNEIVRILSAPGGDSGRNWLHRMCLLQGDAHALGISSTNLWGGFPVFQFASLDSSFSTDQPWRDVGTRAGRAQYGTLAVSDSGDKITFTGTGWAGSSNEMRYSFTVPDVVTVPAAVQSTQDGRYTATITEFGTAIADGDYYHCGVVFTAPPSGRVTLMWSGGIRNLADAETPVAYLSPEVRTGPVVGSGSVVLTAHDSRTVRINCGGVQTMRAGAAHLVTGLVPGRLYNARILHRVTSNTGEFFYRGLIAEPVA
ncbi:MAG TPA: alkaline phosphatase D family protein [Candidatus Limnocylindrales bacterium]